MLRVNILLLEPAERELSSRDPRARHIRKVLHAHAGDDLRAGEIGGALGVATIVSESAGGYVLEFKPAHAPPPLPPVELLLGHPRPIVLKRLLRDLAALGPSAVIVAPTELGEKSYYESSLWSDVRTPLLEGAAQSGTTLVPEVARVASLSDAIGRLRSASDGRLVLHGESVAPASPSGTRPAGARSRETPQGRRGLPPRGIFESLAALGAGRVPGDESWLTVAVGSERGWTAREIALLGNAGFVPCTLGSRVLRTETAATIAVWAAVSWYDGRA